MQDNSYIVQKIFNNNIILVIDNNVEKILFGKGIGFGKHAGDEIALNKSIEKTFIIQDPQNKNKFNQLIKTVDEDIIVICEEIISMISEEFTEELDESIHISLTDHIFFTLKRLKESNEIVNPFLVETEVLFKKEYEIAKKAVSILEKRTGISIPEGETGFITLHIHSARNKGTLSNTIKYAFLANTITEFVEDNLNIELDRDSLDYARFIIHLRFAIERLLKSSPIKNELLTAIKRKYKASYKLAEQIGKIIEDSLEVKVVPDEIGYIAIHLQKLTESK
ncbi:PRD domain-containing protein [Clostridium sp. YIM B02515]|uniref:PRD domain-containing protein n=1 Tax=Clostridium rhizosphaerae TaxID=2803861 RepID=A0ABS1T5X1_9CLOT|nr:PRD domain-containing protein [Clostridium rhizosphaerae]MBL4934742.1 PRD domain-containing protein [Clostridium rhizosphaerae]